MAEPESYYEKRARLSRERLRALLRDEVAPEVTEPSETEPEVLPGRALYEAAQREVARNPPATPITTTPAPSPASEPSDVIDLDVPESFGSLYVAPKGEGAEIRLPQERPKAPSLVERAYSVIDPVTISPREALDFVSLNPDEVWGAPKTEEQKAVRAQTREAEFRRQLAGLTTQERDAILSGISAAPDRKAATQAVAAGLAAREIAAATGEDPTQAFSVLHHRGAVGWDMQTDYRKLVEAHERRLRRDETRPLTDAIRAEHRREAETEAGATVAKILMMDTGHYAVVQDPEAWKERLREIPQDRFFVPNLGVAERYGKALLTTPTSRVYDGTESRASASKWSPLDIFGKLAISTPVGAALSRVPADEFSSAIARSGPQIMSLGLLPAMPSLRMPPPGLVPGMPGYPAEKPTFYDMLVDPATAELVVEGVDMPAVTQHIGRALRTDPILRGYTQSKLPPGVSVDDVSESVLGLSATLPILFLEPDLLSAAFAPAAVAKDVLKGATGLTGLAKVEHLARMAGKGEDLASAPAETRTARAVADLEYEAPEVFGMAHTEALGDLMENPAWKTRTEQVEQASREAVASRGGLAQRLREVEDEATAVGDTVRAEAAARRRAQVALEEAEIEEWRLTEGMKAAEAWEQQVAATAKGGVQTAGARRMPTTATKKALDRFAQVEAEIQGYAARVPELEALHRQIGAATAAGNTDEAARLAGELGEKMRSFLRGQTDEAGNVTAPLAKLLSEYEQLRPLYLLQQAKDGAAAGKKALRTAEANTKAARKALESLPDSSRSLAAARKAVDKVKARVTANEAAAVLPDLWYRAMAMAFRKQRLSFEALLRLPRERRGSAVGLKQAADVDRASPLVFEPSWLGVSNVRLREDSWERVLDSAKITKNPDGTYTTTPQALLDTAERAYGPGTVEAWIKEAGTPEANAFAARLDPRQAKHGEGESLPVGWQQAPLTLSGDDYAALRREWEQLSQFAPGHLQKQPTPIPGRVGEAPDIGRARAVLFQAEADPLRRALGSGVPKLLREWGVRWQRGMNPDRAKFGAHMTGDLTKIARTVFAREVETHSELRELSMWGSVEEVMANVWRYLDTTDPIPHARGFTFGNNLSGRTPWQDFQDYARSVRAARRQMRAAVRAGDKAAQEVFEDKLPPALEAVIAVWLGRGFGALSSDQRAGLVTAGLRAIDRAPTAEAFSEAMAAITRRAFGGDIDTRKARVQGLLATAVTHGAAMRAAQQQIVQSMGGYVSVEEALAVNALLMRGTKRPATDIDRAVALIGRMGLPFAREFHQLFNGIQKSAAVSRKLVAAGVDEATGQAYFVPRHLLDELDATLGNVVKKFEPYAEGPHVPWLYSAVIAAQHLWRMSATAGLIIPKAAYTLTNILFGDLPVVMIHEGPVMAAKVAAQTLPAHLPLYGRVFQKWHDRLGTELPSSLSAFMSPRMGQIFGGREGMVTVGKHTMPARELRAQMVDDEILSTQVGEEIYTSLDGIARNGWISRGYKWWQNEIVGHADLVSRRTRAALYVQLLDEGVPRAEAAARTKGAMLDWSHGFSQWEQGALLRLNIPFYRWWRLSLGQALGVVMDPVTRGADPEYWGKVLTGRSRVARTRQQAQIQSAIPDWAAAYQAENSDGRLDEYDTLSLGIAGRSEWARGRWQFGYIPSGGPEDYYKAFGVTSPALNFVGPEAAGLTTYSWWLNILAAGAAVTAGVLYPDEFETRQGLAWKLLEDNLASMFGPFAITAFSEAEQFRGKARVRVSPGEMKLLAQLDAIGAGLWEADTRQNPETGRWEADAGNVFLIRSLPVIMQIPNIYASTENPYGNEGFGKAFAVALMRQLGIGKLYSRDPDAEQERFLRHARSEMEREIDAATSRSGRRP